MIKKRNYSSLIEKKFVTLQPIRFDYEQFGVIKDRSERTEG